MSKLLTAVLNMISELEDRITKIVFINAMLSVTAIQ